MKLLYKELKLFLFDSQSLAASKEDSELFWGDCTPLFESDSQINQKTFFLLGLFVYACVCLCVCASVCECPLDVSG